MLGILFGGTMNEPIIAKDKTLVWLIRDRSCGKDPESNVYTNNTVGYAHVILLSVNDPTAAWSLYDNEQQFWLATGIKLKAFILAYVSKANEIAILKDTLYYNKPRARYNYKEFADLMGIPEETLLDSIIEVSLA